MEFNVPFGLFFPGPVPFLFLTWFENTPTTLREFSSIRCDVNWTLCPPPEVFSKEHFVHGVCGPELLGVSVVELLLLPLERLGRADGCDGSAGCLLRNMCSLVRLVHWLLEASQRLSFFWPILT